MQNSRWKAANPEVQAAVLDEKIAAVMRAVEKVDAALVADEYTVFAAALAPELVVNNPVNIVASRAVVAQLNADGKISYSQYERLIEHAALRGDMVLLMGEETVVPKGQNPLAGQTVRRRFTELWRPEGERWLLSVRQATVVR
ncbi:MAG TPA: nuclear transport factor 2 family protein [Caulobacter sp.]|nr:nuclear transport factor 2 family protein [Caulobacter sp.]